MEKPTVTEFTLTITIDELNAIGAGLQELPAKVCNPITKKLQEQVNAQLAAQQAAAATTAE